MPRAFAVYRQLPLGHLHHPSYLVKFRDFASCGWVGIVSAMGLIFIAFEGYEIIAQAEEEVKTPGGTSPPTSGRRTTTSWGWPKRSHLKFSFLFSMIKLS